MAKTDPVKKAREEAKKKSIERLTANFDAAIKRLQEQKKKALARIEKQD